MGSCADFTWNLIILHASLTYFIEDHDFKDVATPHFILPRWDPQCPRPVC